MAGKIPEEAEALLTGEPRIGHLGTSNGNEPHVAPLWFRYHEGKIEIATTGRKLANIRQNPRVAISVQEDENGHPQWGIAIQGTAEIIDSESDRRSTLRRINRRYGADDDAWAENTPIRIDVGTVSFWRYEK